MIEEEDERPVLKRSAEEREELAEHIAARMHAPMTALGIIFVLLVLAETIVRPQGTVGLVFTVAGWVLWAAFVLEFVVRLVVAPDTGRFLRRNWWQVIFLALPFLRFLRLLRVARVARISRAGRVGRVLSSAVRGTRTAGKRLRGRIAWLAVTTAIVILAASQILFELGEFDSYGEALYAAAFVTITGEPFFPESGLLRVLEVLLAGYSVAVFATLAGSVGAYLLERSRAERL